MPIDIDYQAPFEQQIGNVLSRLDEIGDAGDGEISDEELNQLMRSLSREP